MYRGSIYFLLCGMAFMSKMVETPQKGSIGRAVIMFCVCFISYMCMKEYAKREQEKYEKSERI